MSDMRGQMKNTKPLSVFCTVEEQRQQICFIVATSPTMLALSSTLVRIRAALRNQQLSEGLPSDRPGARLVDRCQWATEFGHGPTRGVFDPYQLAAVGPGNPGRP
jgi:hypothetical protein